MNQVAAASVSENRSEPQISPANGVSTRVYSHGLKWVLSTT